MRASARSVVAKGAKARRQHASTRTRYAVQPEREARYGTVVRCVADHVCVAVFRPCPKVFIEEGIVRACGIA